MRRIVLALLAVAMSAAPAQAGSPLVVVVRGLRTDHGTVQGAIFDRSSHWLREGGEHSICRVAADEGVARCVFPDVGRGRYAFAFFHDEDHDAALDRDWIGVPQEGFGFSRSRADLGGAPSFDEASFAHDGTTIVIDAQYGI